jgi:hypothetical protein
MSSTAPATQATVSNGSDLPNNLRYSPNDASKMCKRHGAAFSEAREMAKGYSSKGYYHAICRARRPADTCSECIAIRTAVSQ